MSEEDFKYETSYRQYYGKDYDKALNNLRTTKKRLKDEFEKNILTHIWTGSGLTSSYRKPVTSPKRAYATTNF